MPVFTTAFVPPPPVDGLTATAVGGALVRLDWDPSSLSPEDFVSYTVLRSLTGEDYVPLGTINDAAASSWEDYSAPLDRTLYYRVVQSNLDYASDPADVTTALEGCAFWLVTPGAAASSFELPDVTDYDSEWPLQSTEHEPIGRPLKLVETGLLLGEQGTITTHLSPVHDPGILNLLRAAASGSSTEVLLKTPYGEVFRVSLGTIERKRSPGGFQDVSFRFVAV